MPQNRIRQLRERRGLNQRQLAERAGMNQAQLCRLEKGTARLNVEHVARLARALDATEAQVLGQPEGELAGMVEEAAELMERMAQLMLRMQAAMGEQKKDRAA